MSSYLITYYLFLLKETSKSFHVCACESSDDPLLENAVRQTERERERKRGGGKREEFNSLINFWHWTEFQKMRERKKCIQLEMCPNGTGNRIFENANEYE